ncbi:hypothetical protein [Rhizobium sp. PEPV16]|uniref:hypothetical protein n=1 Tax=Rhizobium sp. PEPV16 TaxID=1820614 RepID=UPI001AEFDD00|nr:hypothetical protein [Rhizobium sp. PEPV16]
MESLFRYPGTIKLVPEIKFCGTQLRTNSIDGEGDEHIEECASKDFDSVAIPHREPNMTALLALRGLSDLASIKDSTSDADALTIADPTILIPESPVLAGDFSKFRVLGVQCAKLMRYLRDRQQVKR